VSFYVSDSLSSRVKESDLMDKQEITKQSGNYIEIEKWRYKIIEISSIGSESLVACASFDSTKQIDSALRSVLKGQPIKYHLFINNQILSFGECKIISINIPGGKVTFRLAFEEKTNE